MENRKPPTRSRKRLWLHVPAGVACGFLAFFAPAVGVIFGVAFLVYELSEDWRIRDEAYVDILGFMLGLAGTGVALVLVQLVYNGLGSW